jgi:hypothetical protein
VRLTNIRMHAAAHRSIAEGTAATGYKPLTPIDTQTPIVAFEVKDPAATTKMLQAGHLRDGDCE